MAKCVDYLGLLALSFTLVVPSTAVGTTLICPYGLYGMSSSADGSEFAWITPHALYLASAERPQDYEMVPFDRNCTPAKIRLSGDGRRVFWVIGNRLWVAELVNLRLVNSRSAPIESVSSLYLATNHVGDRVIVGVDSATIPNRCAPGKRSLAYVRVLNSSKFSIEYPFSPADCEHLGGAIIVGADSFIYSAADHSPMFAWREPKGEWSTKPMVHPRFSVSATDRGGTIAVLSTRVGAKRQWPLEGSLYITRRRNTVWSKPVRIFEPLKNPVAWGIDISPNGTVITWTHLLRDEAGQIRSRVLMYVELETNRWSKPAALFDYPGTSQVTGGHSSNRNLLFSVGSSMNESPGGWPQSLYIYDSLAPNGQLTEILNKAALRRSMEARSHEPPATAAKTLDGSARDKPPRPAPPPPANESPSQAAYRKAVRLVQQERLDAALVEARRCIANQEASKRGAGIQAMCHRLAGVLLARLGRDNEAIPHYCKYLDLSDSATTRPAICGKGE